MSSTTDTPPSARPVRIVLGARSHSRLLGLTTYLECNPELVVVDRCQAYERILASLRRTRPDLLVVELDLLGMSVAEMASRVRAARPVRVVALAGARQQRSQRGRAALGVGAVAVLSDSAIDLDAPGTARARSFRCQFQRLAFAQTRIAGSIGPHTTRLERATVIGICASTGGPQALEEVLSRIRPSSRFRCW